MKPRFGLGRRASEDALSASSSLRSDAGEALTESLDDIEAGASEANLDRTAIRPDLGPPAPGPQSANQPGSGLGLVISVAVSAIVFVLAIYATGSPTANPLPLAQTTNALFWLVAALATLGAGIGAVFADRTASRAREAGIERVVEFNTAWIVPVIATAAAILLVATFHNSTMIVAGPLIAFLGNAGALLSRDLLDDADDAAQKTAATIHAVVIHTVAFLALSAIYLNKLPTPIVALLAAVTTILLTIEALDRCPVLKSRKVLLAILAGAAVAAVATPLMWWLTNGWTGAAVLFVAFYCAAGIIQTTIERGALRPRDALEYGLVPLAAFIVLAITA